MTLDFDLEGVDTTEFGVGADDGEPEYHAVPVNTEVQAALLEMACATATVMANIEDSDRPSPLYSPSEKHGQSEYLVVPAGHEFEAALRSLHEAANLPRGSASLTARDWLLSYFARFTDCAGRQLTAVRRAAYFKGILRGRLVTVVDDSLQMVRDDVFKLDKDFDLLVDSRATHILRPSAFEFLGGVQRAILAAGPDNVDAIRTELPFVDFAEVARYAASRPRAARYLASIRTQRLAGVNPRALADLCGKTGVRVRTVNGRLLVERGSEMGFLEVLDRRRYELELVPGGRERFRASSRNPIGT